MDWRRKAQEMVPVPIFTTKALVEHPVSGLLLWSALDNVVNRSEDVGSGV